MIYIVLNLHSISTMIVRLNGLNLKVLSLQFFYPLEDMSRCRDPQLQVNKKHSHVLSLNKNWSCVTRWRDTT